MRGDAAHFGKHQTDRRAYLSEDPVLFLQGRAPV